MASEKFFGRNLSTSLYVDGKFCHSQQPGHRALMLLQTTGNFLCASCEFGFANFILDSYFRSVTHNKSESLCRLSTTAVYWGIREFIT